MTLPLMVGLSATPADDDIPKQVPDNVIDLDEAQKQIDANAASIEALNNENDFLCAYLEFGSDLGLNALGITEGYLATTAMGMYGLEAINEESVIAATEALGAEFMTKLKGWMGKAASTLKSTGSAIFKFITDGWGKVSKMAASFKDTAGKVIRSYPMTVAMAAVMACVGLGTAAPAMLRTIPGLVTGVGRAGSAALSATRTADGSSRVVAILNRLVSAIKWPFARLSVALRGKRIELVTTETPVSPSSGTAQALGWTRTAVGALMGRLRGVTQFAPKLSDMAFQQVSKDIGDVTRHVKAGSYGKAAGSLAFKGLIYFPFITTAWGVVTATFKLIKTIIWGTFTLLKTALSKVTGGSTAEDTANA